jgi:hypothetical protein
MPTDILEGVVKNWPGDFVWCGQDAMSWASQAQILQFAARAVLQRAKEDLETGVSEERRVDAVYKSLAGMALENLLKAIMVRDDPSLVGKYRIAEELKRNNIWSTYADSSGQHVKFLDGTQDVTGSRLQSVMAEDGTEQVLKHVLSKDEQDFLRIVEDYLKWIGRFPIALYEKDFMKNIDSVKNSRLANLSLDDFDALFEVTYQDLNSLVMGVNLKKEKESTEPPEA